MSTVNSAGLSGDEVKKIVTDSIKSAKTAVTELWDVGTKFDGEIKCGNASAAQNFLMPVGTFEKYVEESAKQATYVGTAIGKCLGMLAAIEREDSPSAARLELLVGLMIEESSKMSRSGETMCKSTNEICTTFDKALESGLSTAGSDRLATIKLDLTNAKAELTSLRAKSEQAKSFKWYPGLGVVGDVNNIFNAGKTIAAKVSDPFESQIKDQENKEKTADTWIDSYEKQSKALTTEAQKQASKFREELDSIALVWRMAMACGNHLLRDVLQGLKFASGNPSMISEKTYQASKIYNNLAIYVKSPVFVYPK